MVNGVVLPPGIDTSGTFQDVTLFGAQALGASFAYLISGSYYEQIVSLDTQLVTDATVTNRTFFLSITNSDGKTVVNILPVALQGGNVAIGYSYLSAISAPYNLAGNQQVLGFPHILLEPSWTVSLLCGNLQANDRIQYVRIVTLRSPNVREKSPNEIPALLPLAL